MSPVPCPAPVPAPAPASTELVVRPLPPPGFYESMPAKQYHEIEAMSSGGLKQILRSKAHYKLFRTKKREPTAAMQFGTAVHTGVLEPQRFESAVVLSPTFNKRTDRGKADAAAFAAAHAGAVILDADDFERCRRVIAAIRAHRGAARLLDGAQIEGSMFWIDARYKVPCKARFDARNPALGCGLVDVKTTQDACPEEFARAIASYRYHAQGAHYMSGAEHIFDATPAFFAFIAAEVEEPFGVACYTLPGAGVLAGAHLANRALARYAEALAEAAWPAYPDTVESITLPKWATRFDQ